MNYHARSFNNRTDDTKRAVYLGLLFDASRTLSPMYGKDFFEEDYIIHANIKTFLRKGCIDKGQSINPEITHQGHQRRAFKGIGRLSNNANSVCGNTAHELTGKNVLRPRSAQSIVAKRLEWMKSAKALAHRLWFSFVMEGNDVLHLSDVQEVLGSDSHDIAEEWFKMFDLMEMGMLPWTRSQWKLPHSRWTGKPLPEAYMMSVRQSKHLTTPCLRLHFFYLFSP